MFQDADPMDTRSFNSDDEGGLNLNVTSVSLKQQKCNNLITQTIINYLFVLNYLLWNIIII